MRFPLLIILAILTPPALVAQAEPWLAEVPAAQRVATELQAGDSRINAVRAAAALYSFTNLMQSLIGAQSPSTAARARLAELMPARDRISNMEYAKDGETYKFERCKAAVDESPEFHLDAERHAQARLVLDSAVRLEPRNPKALYLLGRSLQELSFKDSTLADLYSEADSIFELAFAFENRDAELLVDLGDVLSEISGKEQAYERALALNPPPKLAARARMGLGWFSHFMLSYEEAIPQFEEAIRLDPPNPPAVYAIGWMYVRLKRFPQARAIHRQLLGIDREKANQLLKDIDKALNPKP